MTDELAKRRFEKAATASYVQPCDALLAALADMEADPVNHLIIVLCRDGEVTAFAGGDATNLEQAGMLLRAANMNFDDECEG